MPPRDATWAWRLDWSAGLPAFWRWPLVHLALAWLFLIALHAGDWVAMAGQWWNSSTYNHVLFIPLITAWLVGLRLPEIASMRPSTWLPGVLLLAMALFVWLLGAVSGLDTARQLGAVLSLQAALIAILGPRVARALTFPLAYMFFLAPFGDELVPALQMVTAHITIALTLWSGIPAAIEGIFIDTPAGLFRVAEACSGVKFLVAMIALGVLVAHLCFRSWTRRILFLAACVIVPILANGVRAWGTIYIAQFRGIEFARGWDHIFYGWVFFGIVIVIVLGFAWRFFDRHPGDRFVDPGLLAGHKERGWPGGLAVLAMVVALSACSQAWARAAIAMEADLPGNLSLPQVQGWERRAFRPVTPWTPSAMGSERRLLGSYAREDGAKVDVFYAYYRSQGEGREAGGHGQGAIPAESAWSWERPAAETIGGKAEWLHTAGPVRRMAVTWYRTGNVLTGSNLVLKLAVMKDRLLFRREATEMLIVSAEDAQTHHAADAVTDFVHATGGLAGWMDGIAKLP